MWWLWAAVFVVLMVGVAELSYRVLIYPDAPRSLVGAVLELCGLKIEWRRDR